VERTRDVIAQRSDPIYTQLWTRLSSFQQRALLALLREGGVGLATNAVARRYRLSIPALAKSLKLLERKSIIREEQTLGNTRLRLEDPFFGAWIALVIPA
jgi:DNA-binding MarR family transcriptional regulator